ncbi:Crp/Fnr family transcriptional regulator [Phenylobacterium sp. VNQ135]|uniref:Crp/Fnr family transcriptional regulator n=1 Tax=Phenylobacterium sp. VNQ135 TaxID=3400922 RepID=UPI003BFC1542
MINALRPGATPLDLLLRRFCVPRRLRPDDVARFGEATTDAQSHPAGAELSSADGHRPGLRLVASGFIAEVRTMSDGRRQITALRIPGDLLGDEWSPQPCDVIALTSAQTVDASALATARKDPSGRFDPWRQAWAAAQAEEEGRMADHIVRLGRLTAYERMGHLLLELHERLMRVGLAGDGVFHLPLTQEALADVLGLSIVHVNRTLQQLRKDGLVNYRPGQVALPDPQKLAAACLYAPRAGVRHPARAETCGS